MNFSFSALDIDFFWSEQIFGLLIGSVKYGNDPEDCRNLLSIHYEPGIWRIDFLFIRVIGRKML